MINLYKQDGETLYGVKEYILDSPEDIPSLPTNIRPGSTALVISTSNIYMLNGSKQWVLMGGDSSSGGGSGDNAGDLNQYGDNAGTLIEF